MSPTAIHRDMYLDARLPQWQEAERAGRVLYQPNAGVVEVTDAGIIGRLTDFAVNYKAFRRWA